MEEKLTFYYIRNFARKFGTLLEMAYVDKKDMNIFYYLLVRSSIIKEIENGNIKYLNLTPNELYYEINKDKKVLKREYIPYRGSYYWAGMMLTYFVFKYDISYKEINNNITLEEVANSYYPLHEASEDKFFEFINSNLNKDKKDTNLRIYRKLNNLSQNQLSEISGVELRSIEMYEQRRNDINKAQSITLYKLSKALGCTIEDILEI